MRAFSGTSLAGGNFRSIAPLTSNRPDLHPRRSPRATHHPQRQKEKRAERSKRQASRERGGSRARGRAVELECPRARRGSIGACRAQHCPRCAHKGRATPARTTPDLRERAEISTAGEAGCNGPTRIPRGIAECDVRHPDQRCQSSASFELLWIGVVLVGPRGYAIH